MTPLTDGIRTSMEVKAIELMGQYEGQEPVGVDEMERRHRGHAFYELAIRRGSEFFEKAIAAERDRCAKALETADALAAHAQCLRPEGTWTIPCGEAGVKPCVVCAAVADYRKARNG